MGENEQNINLSVSDYYSGKIREYGPTPRGVDWNSGDSQTLRFEQIAKIIDPGAQFTLSDIGCGYGALFDYLSDRYDAFSYEGCDISATMIDAARKRIPSAAASFTVSSKPARPADYVVASGIFNVRLDWEDDVWSDYIEDTLDMMDRCSDRGFAFNCLSSYSDADRRRPDLFYADPLVLFDRCKRRYSRQVALLHDYGLYEFTILVRKGR